MARQKLIHIHSNATNDQGMGPKLPTADQIEYGEIAVNYLSQSSNGVPTLSIKDSADNIVTFTNDTWRKSETNGIVDTAISPVKTDVTTLQNQMNSLIYGDYTYVDLGLPSGTKWANMNIGAASETDYGLFFQWGDTVGHTSDEAKTTYSYWTTCPGNDGKTTYDSAAFTTWKTSNLTDSVLNKSVDAAYMQMKGTAKLPTQTQCEELVDNTTNEWVTDFKSSGVAGCKFTSKKDTSKYIFIPAAGYVSDGVWKDSGNSTSLWAASLSTSDINAYGIYMTNGNVVGDYESLRYIALSARGVHGDSPVKYCNDEWTQESIDAKINPVQTNITTVETSLTAKITEQQTTIDGLQEQLKYLQPGFNYVDLGLTSGTKWMMCNVGAYTATEYGLYFQHGDTVGYRGSDAAAHSTWATAPCNGGNEEWTVSSCYAWSNAHTTNLLLNTDVDGAYAKTNGLFQLPTKEQVTELMNGTTRVWTTVNGVVGMMFISKADTTKYIFIPASGYYTTDGIYGEKTNAKIMVRDIDALNMSGGSLLEISNNSASLNSSSSMRMETMNIRGVKVD